MNKKIIIGIIIILILLGGIFIKINNDKNNKITESISSESEMKNILDKLAQEREIEKQSIITEFVDPLTWEEKEMYYNLLKELLEPNLGKTNELLKKATPATIEAYNKLKIYYNP